MRTELDFYYSSSSQNKDSQPMSHPPKPSSSSPGATSSSPGHASSSTRFKSPRRSSVPKTPDSLLRNKKAKSESGLSCESSERCWHSFIIQKIEEYYYLIHGWGLSGKFNLIGTHDINTVKFDSIAKLLDTVLTKDFFHKENYSYVITLRCGKIKGKEETIRKFMKDNEDKQSCTEVTEAYFSYEYLEKMGDQEMLDENFYRSQLKGILTEEFNLRNVDDETKIINNYDCMVVWVTPYDKSSESSTSGEKKYPQLHL